MGELTGCGVDEIVFVIKVADLDVHDVFARIVEYDIKICIVLRGGVILALHIFTESRKLG